jgi:hypothetical protein
MWGIFILISVIGIIPLYIYISSYSQEKSEWMKGWDDFRHWKEPESDNPEYLKGWYANCDYKIVDKSGTIKSIPLYSIDDFEKGCKKMTEAGAKPEYLQLIKTIERVEYPSFGLG